MCTILVVACERTIGPYVVAGLPAQYSDWKIICVEHELPDTSPCGVLNWLVCLVYEVVAALGLAAFLAAQIGWIRPRVK